MVLKLDIVSHALLCFDTVGIPKIESPHPQELALGTGKVPPEASFQGVAAPGMAVWERGRWAPFLSHGFAAVCSF